jgi:Zn/Cd-binding protein ZinT
MGSVRGRLRRLEREAKEGAVLIHQRDRSVKAFDAMEVGMEMFMAHYELFMGNSYKSEVLEAVRGATLESRAAFEEQFGEISFEAKIIATDYQGGWVEVYTLLEDGTVERVCHEGDSEEAERIRQEARQHNTAGPIP